METTGEVCLDYLAVCRKAAGTLMRRAVCRYVERDELVSEGYMAVLQSGATDEALAVTVARRAMINLIRKTEVRQRDREFVTDVDIAKAAGSVGDAMDWKIYGARNTDRPEGVRLDIWEALSSLPTVQYRAAVLLFWGNRSQSEIATELGVGQQHVSRILSAMKNNLREICVKRNSQTITNMRGNSATNGAGNGHSIAARSAQTI